VNDATLSSTDGQRMTEKIVSEKSQLLAQALMLEQVIVTFQKQFFQSFAVHPLTIG
jgi:hypothetical protein